MIESNNGLDWALKGVFVKFKKGVYYDFYPMFLAERILIKPFPRDFKNLMFRGF